MMHCYCNISPQNLALKICRPRFYIIQAVRILCLESLLAGSETQIRLGFPCLVGLFDWLAVADNDPTNKEANCFLCAVGLGRR